MRGPMTTALLSVSSFFGVVPFPPPKKYTPPKLKSSLGTKKSLRWTRSSANEDGEDDQVLSLLEGEGSGLDFEAWEGSKERRKGTNIYIMVNVVGHQGIQFAPIVKAGG